MASIVESTDFTDNALADNGVTVSRTPVTTTFSGNGDEIRTDGTPENIIVILHLRQPEYSQNEEGLLQTKTGYVMTGPSQALNRNDKITYNSNTYRVLDVLPRGVSGSTVFYKYANIILIE